MSEKQKELARVILQAIRESRINGGGVMEVLRYIAFKVKDNEN